ncbi:MAG: AMP-binding protein, partial [Candidatus Bathyarchaeota archaeon]|nr:AMP-binding protein [Candidatus Bathyarchaeota archaeon]
MEKKPRPKYWPERVPRSIEYPEEPLFSLLERTAEKHPDATAIIFQNRKLSYRYLKELVDRFATALQSMEVEKGDRVALFLP